MAMAYNQENTAKAYSEILEFIRALGPKYEEKIPDSIMNVFRNNCDPDWVIHLDAQQCVGKDTLIHETLVLVSWLNLEYWETSEEKKKELMEAYERNGMLESLKTFREIKADNDSKTEVQ